MARDYKQPKSRAKSFASPPAWLAFVSGLALGLAVAMYFYLQLPAATGEGTPASEPTPVVQKSADPPTPVAANTVNTTAAKPRFDFYTILPEAEVKVPEWQIEKRDDASGQPALMPGQYVLQVGSFQKFEEADRVKATLALKGLNANIQKVSVGQGETWFRVRLGPFQDQPAVDAAREKLIAQGMDFMLLKIKD